MTQFVFGAGVMVATGVLDANGAAISPTQPSPYGVLQDVSVDFEYSLKPLYGDLQFPVAIGRGEGKITGKAKSANISSVLFNNFFFGQTLTSGLTAIFKATVAVAIPATPFQITPTPPSSGTWDSDMGVIDSNGRLMTHVASGPTAGQYAVTAGVYTFASADNVSALSVFISYRYTASVAGAKNMSVVNLPMGYAPSTQIDLSTSFNGKFLCFRFPNVIAPKLSLQFKNTDWAIPEYEFECFADNLNNIAYISASNQ